MFKKIFILLVIVSFTLSSCTEKPSKLTPEQAKEIAEEAYIFAFPMIDHYKMMFAQAMYPESGAYVAPFNQFVNMTSLNGPKDTIIVRPNNDTFYSGVWFDLSGQPYVLKVPAITDNRYYSFQFIDMYTHNTNYVGTRTTGFDAGNYMIAGPNWTGETPEGINKVIRSEGSYLLALGRTQVFGPKDAEKAQAIMAENQLVSLSEFTGEVHIAVVNNPPPFPPYNRENAGNENFIAYLNALMTQGEIHPTEKELFQRFAKIGIEPGKDFNSADFDAEIIKAINEGIASATEKIKDESTKLGERKNGWQLVSGAFGSREAMQGKYLTRAAAAYFGLYGNDLEEAFYPETTFDADSADLDGSKYNYTLHFDADKIPPVKAFWSLSMYKLPEQLFIENEINRYVVSSVTEGLQYNEDGSLDVYIQKENPGKDKESNWLPAHNGKFSIQARLYWIEQSGLNPLYKMPAVQKITQ